MAMISNVTKKLVIFSIKWGSLFGAFPYEWNDQISKMKCTSKALKKWVCSATYLVIYTIFVLIRIIQLLHQGKLNNFESRFDFFKGCVMFMGTSMFCVLHYSLFVNKELVIGWIHFYLDNMEQDRGIV